MPHGFATRVRRVLPAALLPFASLVFSACAASEPRAPAPSAPEEPPSPPVSTEIAAATFDDAWTTVRDSHFDPTLNGVDWDAVREELRPRAAAATTQRDLRLVLSDMLGRLGQSHFAVIPREVLPPLEQDGADPDVAAAGAEAGAATDGADAEEEESRDGDLGFDVRARQGVFLVTRVDEGGPAQAAGVRPGWILERLDGKDLGALIAEIAAVPDPNVQRYASFAAYEVASERMLGAVGSEAACTFEDQEDRKVELVLRRAKRDVIEHEFGENLPTFHLRFDSDIVEHDGKRIGWIHFTNWFVPMMKPIADAVDRMRACDGIVLDLRGNTGGAAGMTIGVAGHFFDQRTDLGTMTTRVSEMKFVALPQKVNSAGQVVAPFSGPVAILVDDLTGSASEVFAGGMQSSGRARVFGETTAGAVLPASTKTLPNGDGLLYVIADFKDSNGKLLEGGGVEPDVTVPLTRAALLAEGDPALEAAIDWISATPDQ